MGSFFSRINLTWEHRDQTVGLPTVLDPSTWKGGCLPLDGGVAFLYNPESTFE